jgi:hypothetical protein
MTYAAVDLRSRKRDGLASAFRVGNDEMDTTKTRHLRKPAFLVTIDTECDDAWARSQEVTTRNSAYLPRFQSLCERYGIRPTYLTNWEMANCPVFQDFGRDLLARGAGEIGMHLHAWNSPPVVPLTEDDYVHHPYLVEFPEDQLREKVKIMTFTLEDVFGVKMVSHRAGRFSFDEVYARALVDLGYRVDVSVTPNVSWAGYKGDPNGAGGTDFSEFPESAYFLDLADISRPGASPLLEVPVTITAPYFSRAARMARAILETNRLGAKVARRLFPRLARLDPKGYNHRALPRLLRTALVESRDYAELMLHSSELMPGGSPNFPTARSIEGLYDVLEELFAIARRKFTGLTLDEYFERFTAREQTVQAKPRQTSAVGCPVFDAAARQIKQRV